MGQVIVGNGSTQAGRDYIVNITRSLDGIHTVGDIDGAIAAADQHMATLEKAEGAALAKRALLGAGALGFLPLVAQAVFVRSDGRLYGTLVAILAILMWAGKYSRQTRQLQMQIAAYRSVLSELLRQKIITQLSPAGEHQKSFEVPLQTPPS